MHGLAGIRRINADFKASGSRLGPGCQVDASHIDVRAVTGKNELKIYPVSLAGANYCNSEALPGTINTSGSRIVPGALIEEALATLQSSGLRVELCS